MRCHVMLASRFEHEQSNQVVGDGLQMDLLFDHIRSKGAEHIEAESRFDIPKVQFYLPAAEVKLCDGRVRIAGLIQQGGDHCDLIGGSPAPRRGSAPPAR